MENVDTNGLPTEFKRNIIFEEENLLTMCRSYISESDSTTDLAFEIGFKSSKKYLLEKN